MRAQRILIIDDDSEIRHLVYVVLSDDYEVLEATNGADALQIIENESPDLVILDIVIPKIDGIEVLRRLRQWSSVPVIVLSARGGMTDKAECLNLGADDYMTKPFGVEELMARVRAMLRRSSVIDTTPTIPLFTSRDLQIDFVKRRVTKAGHEKNLTPIEYNLLRELTLNAGNVLNYRHLLNKIWGPEYGTEREYLYVYIGYLRSKIEVDPKHPDYIITIPGVGYRFNLLE